MLNCLKYREHPGNLSPATPGVQSTRCPVLLFRCILFSPKSRLAESRLAESFITSHPATCEPWRRQSEWRQQPLLAPAPLPSLRRNLPPLIFWSKVACWCGSRARLHQCVRHRDGPCHTPSTLPGNECRDVYRRTSSNHSALWSQGWWLDSMPADEIVNVAVVCCPPRATSASQAMCAFWLIDVWTSWRHKSEDF